MATLPLLLPLLLAPAAPAVPQGRPLPEPVLVDETSYGGLTVMFNYDDDPACADDPLNDCKATLFSLYYPDGTGPQSLGYPPLPAEERMPVLIGVHGGGLANSNQVPLLAWGFFRSEVTSFPWDGAPGVLGVETNYPPVSASTDVTFAATGVAYLVQWLRAHADELNLDPESIVLWGRSYGGLVTLATGLRVNNQDSLSRDPIEHERSQPDALLPFAGLADLTCFAPDYVPSSVVFFSFPESMGAGGTPQQKELDSATYWVQHPEVFGLEAAPPIGAAYVLSSASDCGEVIDPHDGVLGYRLAEAVSQIPANERPAFQLWDSQLEIEIFSATPYFEICLQWALEQVRPLPPRRTGPKPLTPSPF